MVMLLDNFMKLRIQSISYLKKTYLKLFKPKMCVREVIFKET